MSDEMKFTAPDGMVLSIRLNREELHALTEGARFHGMKLSTYIKAAAVKAASGPLVRLEYADGIGCGWSVTA